MTRRRVAGDPQVRRLSACEGKVVFNTFARAAATAHRQAQRRKRGKFVAYACKDCGKYHVGVSLAGDGDVAPQKREVLQPFRVYGRRNGGPSVMLGRSTYADGGAIARMMRAQGWIITEVTDERS